MASFFEEAWKHIEPATYYASHPDEAISDARSVFGGGDSNGGSSLGAASKTNAAGQTQICCCSKRYEVSGNLLVNTETGEVWAYDQTKNKLVAVERELPAWVIIALAAAAKRLGTVTAAPNVVVPTVRRTRR